MRGIYKLLLVLAGVMVVASAGSYAYHASGMKPHVDKKEMEAQAKATQKHQEHVRKLHNDRVNDVNIDEVTSDMTGYTISMNPGEADNKIVKPKSMKVYKKENGKLKDITKLGKVSTYDNDKFIRWTYKHKKGNNLQKELKSDIGNKVVFDVEYEKAIHPNSITKEEQFVNKQIDKLEQQISNEHRNHDKEAVKKNRKALKETKAWKKELKKDKKDNYRYEHEIRYEK